MPEKIIFLKTYTGLNRAFKAGQKYRLEYDPSGGIDPGFKLHRLPGGNTRWMLCTTVETLINKGVIGNLTDAV